jgi:hypothetical protein
LKLLLTIVIGASAETALGAHLTAPLSASSMDMDSANEWPFIYPEFAPLRYQQLYESRLFEHILSPIIITEIAFRPDALFGTDLSAMISDISMSMSTTHLNEFSLSGTDLDSNLGSGNIEVMPRRSLFVSTSVAGGTPKAFDFVITLDQPFVFDPAAGNLLIEVNNFSAEKLRDTFSSGHLDASESIGDGLARAWSFLPTAPGFGTDSWALVTRFSYARVPEAPALPLSCAVILCVALNPRLLARRADAPASR